MKFPRPQTAGLPVPSVFTLLGLETVVRTPEYMPELESQVERPYLATNLSAASPMFPVRGLMLGHGAEFDVVVAARSVRQDPVRVPDRVGDLQHLDVFGVKSSATAGK